MMKSRIYQSITVMLFFCIGSGVAFAQNQTQRPWWYTFERGKAQFRNGDYGGALLSFDDARRQRRDRYDRLEASFISLLSIGTVRRIGDSLDLVERFARDQRYAGALEALDELYYRVPKESLNNSATAALTAIGRLKNYPEVEYWLGETYRAEGELGLAISQFQKTYELRDMFETPGFTTDLLYKMAAIHKTRQEYNEMERNLLLIIAGDTLWTNANEGDQQAVLPESEKKPPVPYAEASASFARQAMTKTLEGDKAPTQSKEQSLAARFLTMYRYTNTQVEEAHRLLGWYYYASGRHTRAQEHLMFAFLIQNSVIIEEIIRRQYDFAFTGLEALAAEINRSPQLSEYAEKVDYYRTAYYLGASLYGNGKAAAARELWAFLGAQGAAGEWQGRSLAQIRSPHVERAVEMP